MPKQLSFHRRFEKRALERKQKRLNEGGPMSLEAVEKEDAAAIKEQKAKFGKGPFLAADAVVKSADDFILLIRRGTAPQKGVHALPGGKLDEGETFLEACLRELREETGLVAAPNGELEAIDFAGCLVGLKVNDRPDRDPRGRWISIAYHFSLPYSINKLFVEAGDDAVDAEWVRAGDFKNFSDDQFFADHLEIVRYFTWRNG